MASKRVSARMMVMRGHCICAQAIKPGMQSKYAKTKKLADKKALQAVEATIARVNAEIEAMHEASTALGGRMILVDLAGSDSDDRGVEKAGAAELKESRMINKSLLALKECLRGLHVQQTTGTRQKMPFRDSSITRLLEEVLVPKRGRDSDTVMLVNCAQPARLERKTINSLRYGQLYAAGTGRKPKGGGGGGGGESFMCVCWVAVPKAMRARRANRRGTSSGCGGLRGCASAAMRSGGAGGAAGHLCRAHREDGRRRGRDFGSVRRERSWAACEGEGQVFRHSMMYWASVPLQQDCRRSDDLLAESL
jgi:hypothetical protein|eukprot:COSAG01_NODE_2848_length_6979_cov_12.425000_3_plen_308_part_00